MCCLNFVPLFAIGQLGTQVSRFARSAPRLAKGHRSMPPLAMTRYYSLGAYALFPFQTCLFSVWEYARDAKPGSIMFLSAFCSIRPRFAQSESELGEEVQTELK